MICSMRHAVLIVALAGFVPLGRSAEKALEVTPAYVLKAMRGVVSLRQNLDYSRSINDMYLGYDAAGDAVVGVASRRFKSYEKINVATVVRRKAGELVIGDVLVPDIGVIKKPEKQAKVLEAVKAAVGKTVETTDGELQTVDAVSGATRYHKRVTTTINFLAKAIVTEMKAVPDWPERPLDTQSP